MTDNIYKYINYRVFLRDLIENKITNKGLSYRYFAKRCGINAPNYFQQIIARKRNISDVTALKIAQGLDLDSKERKYFFAMVRLENAKDGVIKEQILAEMRRMAARSDGVNKKITDPSIHDHWLNSVMFELASTKGFTSDINDAATMLSGVATHAEIRKAFDFLVAKGYLVKSEKTGAFTQRPIVFQPLNDVRRIDLQRSHMRFLELAKHRLIDDIDEREYQGLTIAIRKDKLPLIKSKLREFIVSLNEDLSGDSEADQVIRIQLCAFRIT